MLLPPYPPVPPRTGRPGPRRGRRSAGLVTGLLATGLLMATLGACSGSDGEASSDGGAGIGGDTSSDRSQSGDAVVEDLATSPGAGKAGGSADLVEPADDLVRGTSPGAGSGLTAVDPSQLTTRDVIRTGSVWLVAEDPLVTRDRIVALVDTLGGYVSDESASTAGSDLPRQGGLDEVRVVLQVPTGRFDEAVERLSRLGRVTSRAIQAQDVTGQVADVESRVESARTALERIRALLDRANGLGTVIRLEGVLSRRQSDLEALLAQQSALAGQTQLATLEVTVSGKPDRSEPGDGDDAGGFLDGLRLGWDGLHDTYVAASTAAGAVLPFAVLGAAVALPLLVWRRRRVSPQPATSASDPQ